MSPARPALLLATLLLAVQPAAAYTEATAYASANEYSLLCSTCSIDFQILGTQEDGGPGATAAFAEVAGAGYAGIAHSLFTGPYALPELSAYAHAEVISPGFPDLHTYFYEALGSASALQQYTYGGAAPETYTITYTLDGEFSLTAADAASLMSVYGGITVYMHPYEPFGEFHPNYGYDYQGDHAELVGTHPFLLTGSVTFTVQPGDIFYVAANLYATADSSHQVEGSADALHTLALEFTSGDASLLTPEAAAVPEPGTLALVGLGLGLVGVRQRARGSGTTLPVPHPRPRLV
jgi:hypothetical protein